MKLVQKIISSILAETYGIHIPEAKINLENPPKSEFGDYAFSCFTLARETRKSPNILAEEVKFALSSQEGIHDVSTIGGYVNFFVDKKLFIKETTNLSLEPKEKKNETIIVDYVGANAGKPLHIGHLCTPSTGQAFINMFRHLGYDVIGDTHFGDWGGIFGKLIFIWKSAYFWDSLIDQKLFEYTTRWNTAIQLPEEQEKIKNEILEKNGAKLLMSMYVNFHTTEGLDGGNFEFIEKRKEEKEEKARLEFKKLSEGDAENVELWKKFTEISIAETKKQMETLNVEADYDIGESFYEGLDLPKIGSQPDLIKESESMKIIGKELLEKNIASKNEDGSVGVIFPEESKIPSCALVKRDGTGLYLTSELACLKYRSRIWKPARIIYCVDIRQQLHLKQAFWIAKKAWPELENTDLYHAANGFIKLPDGAMSTRKGNVIFLDALIDEAFERTKKILEEKGQNLTDDDIQAIAVGSLKYSYLSQDLGKDITFDWDKALAFDGNSGPYIQYTFVRAKNIISKATESNIPININQGAAESLTSHDIDLMKLLFRFDEAVLDAAAKYKPHILAQYCFSLANAFNSFYVHTPKILEETNDALKSTRLALVEKTAETLEKGFELLAIKMPSKM